MLGAHMREVTRTVENPENFSARPRDNERVRPRIVKSTRPRETPMTSTTSATTTKSSNSSTHCFRISPGDKRAGKAREHAEGLAAGVGARTKKPSRQDRRGVQQQLRRPGAEGSAAREQRGAAGSSCPVRSVLASKLYNHSHNYNYTYNYKYNNHHIYNHSYTYNYTYNYYYISRLSSLGASRAGVLTSSKLAGLCGKHPERQTSAV